MTLSVPSEQIDLTREPPFRLGAMEVVPAAREVVVDGRREVLEPRIMQVLVALARRRDEVVTRDELIVMCWSGRVVGEDAITRCIGRVRRLSETGGGFCLETIPRLGYRLTEKSAASPVVEAVAPEQPQPSSWLARHWRKLAVGVPAVLLAVLGVLAAWLLWPQAQPPPRLSIAVLPFTPLPGDREAEQLADAVSTSIADMLSSEGQEVVSPAKTRQFRGASKADAAQALHATFVIDGELRRQGGKFLVTLRIIDGASGTTLIADSVEAADPASLPEAVGTNVLGSGWGWMPGLNPTVPADRAVLIGVLKAVKHLASPSGTVYAHAFAQQLAVSKPNEAYAHLLHAETAALIMPGRAPDARLQTVLEARAAARRALELDPGLGDAYAPLATMTPGFEWSVRERYLQRGLRLRPSAPLVYMDILDLRMNSGYLRVGGRMAEDSYANHSHFDNTVFEVINARLWLGNVQGARTLARHAIPMYPKLAWFPAKAFEATAFYGALDEADVLLKDPAAAPLLQPEGEGRTYGAIVTALRHRRPAGIQAVVADCLKVTGRSLEFRRICFMTLVKLGRIDDAYRMAESVYPDQRGASEAEIERKWLARYPLDTAYLVIPLTAPLRADPRFRSLAERIGLLRYWKERGIAPDFCAAEDVPVCRELKS